jgi:DNA-binding NtrC family response regulator
MSGTAANSGSVSSAPPHVLVVEDDPGVRTAMSMLLQIEGYRVSTASNVAGSLAVARENRDIGILIVDYHLSDGELGTDAVASIRAILGPAVKAVLITGDTSGAADKMARNNHLRMLRKPVRPDELTDLLRDLQAGRA